MPRKVGNSKQRHMLVRNRYEVCTEARGCLPTVLICSCTVQYLSCLACLACLPCLPTKPSNPSKPSEHRIRTMQVYWTGQYVCTSQSLQSDSAQPSPARPWSVSILRSGWSGVECCCVWRFSSLSPAAHPDFTRVVSSRQNARIKGSAQRGRKAHQMRRSSV